MEYFFEKGKFTEAELENAFIELFQSQGYEYTSGESIHRKYNDILIYDDLKNYLSKRYEDITDTEIQRAISILDNICAEVKRVEAQIKEMTKENEDIELLMTMPGIGFVTAATIASYTRDIERFEGDFKRFSSYLGIVPGVHNSADTVRLGKITKRGPQELRTAFVQVALGIIRQPQNTGDWKLLQDYKTMKVSKGSGRAIIALTRKVARIVFAMINKHEPFDPSLIKRAERDVA